MTNSSTLETNSQVKEAPTDIPKEDYAKMSAAKRKEMEERRQRKIPKRPILNSDPPSIEIVPGHLHKMVDAAQQLLTKNNPGIYQRAGLLVRIVKETTKPKKSKNIDAIKRSPDSLVIAGVDAIYLSEVLGKLTIWTRFDERKMAYVQKDCPSTVSNTLIARREWDDIPVLTGIIQAPTLRSDGSILQVPGYDQDTGLFFDPGQTIFEPIPQSPSKDDAITALKKLRALLADFPFEKKEGSEKSESESVAISAILTGLIRKTIRTAPLHGFTAPKMAAGKSLLADVVGLITTGKSNCVISQAADEAEEQKRLLSVLQEGDPVVCYDNVERDFGSAALCSVLTQEHYKGRVLGVTGTRTVPTNATFLATGNNLSFVGDISTRAILCRIDPQCERPEDRSFNIDLRVYIPRHREELVEAALTIVRAYHVAGRPKQPIKQFGRFEDWSDLVRSAIVWLEMEDPCTSRKEIENADPARKSLSSFLATWYDFLGDISYRLRAIKEKTEEHPEQSQEFLDACLDIQGKGDEISPKSLGKKLQMFKGRIENGYRLEHTGSYQNADTWRVRKIS
jgi:hypothetical protein